MDFLPAKNLKTSTPKNHKK